MSVFDDMPEQAPAGTNGIVDTAKSAGGAVLHGISRTAGALFGAANAPLAFIKGMMNTPTHAPKEWDKLGVVQKGAVMVGGGLESAGRSIGKEGDWGETYDTYYANKTGSTMEKDFGASSNYIKLGLDLMMDPLFGPALGADLASKGVKSIAEFGKYIAKGEIPLGTNKMIKMPAAFFNDMQKLNAQDAAEKVAVRQNVGQELINTLKTHIDNINALEKTHNLTPLDNPVVVYDPAATQNLISQNPGLDDVSKSLVLALDDFSRLPYSTTIASERAAQPMFKGSVPKVSLEDWNPELAKELENFMERGKGGNKYIWKDEPAMFAAEKPVGETLAGTLPDGLHTPGSIAVQGDLTARGTSRLHAASGLAAGVDQDDEATLPMTSKKGCLGPLPLPGVSISLADRVRPRTRAVSSPNYSPTRQDSRNLPKMSGPCTTSRTRKWRRVPP